MAATSNQAAFELDDVHREFRAVCRAFVEREVMPLVRDAEATRTFPAELWKPLGEAGLLGLGHPEENGGSGTGGHLAIAILSEELARASGGIAITPLVSAYMAAPHLAKFGTAEQRRRYLAPLIAGTAVGAIAVTEPGAGSDVAGIKTRAERVAGGWSITGSKMFVTNGGLADTVIVVAISDADAGHSGMTGFIVESGNAGFLVGRELDKMGWHSSDTRELIFDGCIVPDECVLGEPGRAFYQVMQAFQTERITVAAMGVGLGQTACDDAVDYAKVREASGAPIGKYQSVRHKLAEMSILVSAARTVTYRAAALCDADHPDLRIAVAEAKLIAARVANEAADVAVQVFGGYGFIEETRVTMHYRDARILRIGGGTDEVQLEIVSKALGL